MAYLDYDYRYDIWNELKKFEDENPQATEEQITDYFLDFKAIFAVEQAAYETQRLFGYNAEFDETGAYRKIAAGMWILHYTENCMLVDYWSLSPSEGFVREGSTSRLTAPKYMDLINGLTAKSFAFEAGITRKSTETDVRLAAIKAYTGGETVKLEKVGGEQFPRVFKGNIKDFQNSRKKQQ
ncbi:hypothetical protein [Paenibacillus hamazuiensis]|uniref:hypothetical protein n=1 Tax=Paenibacillus hamazuiensis TaxID=2936508 RepID=UPI00200F44FA|nr:hypothetical protein [Paenibacillus hamazuiensis]